MPQQETIIKIAIADDHKIFRKGVVLSMKEYANIKFVQESDNGKDLIDGLPETRPDVVLVDLRMPVKDGIETTKHISRHFPSIKILVLTIYEDEKLVCTLMDSGANGYLLKSDEPAEIKRAIFDVMRKGFYLNNFVNRILIKKNHLKQATPHSDSVTMLIEEDKKFSQLNLMKDTAREIGKKLNIFLNGIKIKIDRLIKHFRKN